MKNRWRWILLLLPVVLLGGFLRWKTSQPEYVLRQLIGRQKKRVFPAVPKRFSWFSEHAAEQHLKALVDWKENQIMPEHYVIPPKPVPMLLLISWYKDEENSISGSVDVKAGFLHIFRLKNAQHERSWHGSARHFTKGELNKIKDFLHQFPSGVAPAPSIEHVLLVSYRDGQEWKARVYDRRYLPQPVRQMLALLLSRATGVMKNEKPDQTQ